MGTQQVGQGWRDRWASFCLVTRNWTVQLPGFDYDGDDRDGFMLRDQVVAYLRRYAASFAAPLRLGVEIAALRRNGAGYVADTSDGPLEARSVIVATGAFQLPRIPALADQLPASVHHLHSSQYRDPESLPDGAVLVTGSGQSGAQIAEELHEAGREVVLAVSRAGRAPRRYRGRDPSAGMGDLGFLEQTVDQLEDPAQQYAANMHVSGKRAGHTINLHAFARDGIRLVGKVAGTIDGTVQLSDDLYATLAAADQRAAAIRTALDEHIAANGIDAPDHDPADDYEGIDGFGLPGVGSLDPAAEGISTVIWTTGYRHGFDWIELDVTDPHGNPVHQRGVTKHPGLCFPA